MKNNQTVSFESARIVAIDDKRSEDSKDWGGQRDTGRACPAPSRPVSNFELSCPVPSRVPRFFLAPIAPFFLPFFWKNFFKTLFFYYFIRGIYFKYCL